MKVRLGYLGRELEKGPGEEENAEDPWVVGARSGGAPRRMSNAKTCSYKAYTETKGKKHLCNPVIGKSSVGAKMWVDMYEAVNLKDKRSKEMEQSLVAPDKLYHKSIFDPSSLLSGFGEKDGCWELSSPVNA